MRLSKDFFLILSIEVIFLLSIFYVPRQYSPEACIIVANIFTILTIIRIIKDGFDDIPLFFFNITYWIFILGGSTVSLIKNGSVVDYISVSLNDNQLLTSCGIAVFGIAFLDIIYYFQGCKYDMVNRDVLEYHGPNKIQGQFIVAIFLVSTICKFAMAFEKMAYSSAFGYVSLYTKETSSLPGPIRYIGAFFYFSLMLYLACDFSKIATYIAFGLTGIVEAMILNSGDRGEAVCGILVLVIYTIFRCRREPDFLMHKKSAVFISCCSLPILTFLLQVIKYTRVGKIADISFLKGIIEFFESQGVSINIIANEIKYRSDITDIAGKSFVVKQIVGYLQQNIMFRTLFGFKRIVGNTVEMATSGFSLGSTIMYLTLPNSYLRGIGCGTCYLAELFQDGRWFGLTVGTVIVSVLLKWIKKMDQGSWIVSAMMLNCMRSVLVLPRGAFFKWMTEMLSIPNLILLLVVCLLGYLREGQVKNETSNDFICKRISL